MHSVANDMVLTYYRHVLLVAGFGDGNRLGAYSWRMLALSYLPSGIQTLDAAMSAAFPFTVQWSLIFLSRPHEIWRSGNENQISVSYGRM